MFQRSPGPSTLSPRQAAAALHNTARPSSLPPALAAARIKDIAQLQSARDNQLVGYGLVIGLQGTGDSLRNSPFTEQSLRSMLDRLGGNVRGSQPRSRN